MKKALAKVSETQKPRTSGTIGAWPEEKRIEFERDCLARALTGPQIAEKYGLTVGRVRQYKSRWLKPELIRAALKRKVQTEESAKGHLSWLINESRDGIDELRGRKKNKDGETIVGDPKKLGTLPELLGKGFEGVRILGEMLGELNIKSSASPVSAVPQIINVISIPKAVGTPQFAPDDDYAGPDYQNMKLLDISPNAE